MPTPPCTLDHHSPPPRHNRHHPYPPTQSPYKITTPTSPHKTNTTRNPPHDTTTTTHNPHTTTHNPHTTTHNPHTTTTTITTPHNPAYTPTPTDYPRNITAATTTNSTVSAFLHHPRPFPDVFAKLADDPNSLRKVALNVHLAMRVLLEHPDLAVAEMWERMLTRTYPDLIHRAKDLFPKLCVSPLHVAAALCYYSSF
ncbi:hypothetical protein ACOMHN_027001 [Nucella lapillus]